MGHDAEAVLIGRSRIVGKPLAQLLLARHATVTMCHTRTADLGAHTRRADVLCVAAGRANMVTADMVKPGAWVIDVGNTQLPPASGSATWTSPASASAPTSRRCRAASGR